MPALREALRLGTSVTGLLHKCKFKKSEVGT